MNKPNLSDYVSLSEEIYYQAFSSKRVYPIFQIILFFIIAIWCFVSDGFLLGSSTIKTIMEKTSIKESVLFLIMLIVHIILLIIWAFSIIKKIDKYKWVYHVITSKNILIFYMGEICQIEAIAVDKITKVKESGKGFEILFNDDVYKLKFVESKQDMINALKLLKLL